MARIGPPNCAQCGIAVTTELEGAEDSDLLTVLAECEGIKWRFQEGVLITFASTACHARGVDLYNSRAALSQQLVTRLAGSSLAGPGIAQL